MTRLTFYTLAAWTLHYLVMPGKCDPPREKSWQQQQAAIDYGFNPRVPLNNGYPSAPSNNEFNPSAPSNNEFNPSAPSNNELKPSVQLDNGINGFNPSVPLDNGFNPSIPVDNGFNGFNPSIPLDNGFNEFNPRVPLNDPVQPKLQPVQPETVPCPPVWKHGTGYRTNNEMHGPPCQTVTVGQAPPYKTSLDKTTRLVQGKYRITSFPPRLTLGKALGSIPVSLGWSPLNVRQFNQPKLRPRLRGRGKGWTGYRRRRPYRIPYRRRFRPRYIDY